MPLYSIETHGRAHPAIEQEWLLTDGLGGFSSGTVAGCNTRRYHALLCAATLPPVGRVVALNRIGEILTIGRDVHELSINQFGPDTFHPRGERYLRRFDLGETARWEYDVAGVRVVKELLLCWKRAVAMIRYEVQSGGQPVELALLPMVSLRDFHSLQTGTDRHYNVRLDGQRLVIGGGEHSLHLRCAGAEFHHAPDWWNNHYYAIDAERGQDHVEDLFTPGRFIARFERTTNFTLFASLAGIQELNWDAEIARRAAMIGDDRRRIPKPLRRAANDFIVDRRCPDGTPGVTVLAGYPWFADWGRDTMISLPGLFLATGRFKEAAGVLSLFAGYVSEGMIPNKFDDYTNQPQYNTVDASLWFIHACFEYLRASEDSQTFQKSLLPACRAIVEGYSRGTRYNIHADPADGLITQGDATTQLTWMDAKCNDVCFTPRQGKPVEINALWYNALVLMDQNDRAARVRESFVRSFWMNPDDGLCDVVDGDRRDGSIRPNQIFAVSLPHSPLDRNQQRAVVDVVRRELLTPYGLRTLSPIDPNFKARYEGPQFQRDMAYHNGTIWPWLIGAFLEAHLKVNDRSTASVQQARQWLSPLIESMESIGCIGQIAEIFEAAPPHRPVGCGAQAWSVAEVLRLATMLEM